MSLEDKTPKELATMVSYFMDAFKDGINLGYEALDRLLEIAEGQSADELPIREDNTVLHALPRPREGFKISKVSRPFDRERDMPEEDTGDTE